MIVFETIGSFASIRIVIKAYICCLSTYNETLLKIVTIMKKSKKIILYPRGTSPKINR